MFTETKYRTIRRFDGLCLKDKIAALKTFFRKQGAQQSRHRLIRSYADVMTVWMRK